MQAVYIASLLNSTDPPDLEELRAIARDVGFLSPEIRRQAWPLLLGVKLKVEEASKNASSQALSTTHKDNKQVQLDVIRSMCNLGLRRREREQRLNDLSTVIDSILAANPDLHYYQGFNDVCSIAILVPQPPSMPTAGSHCSSARTLLTQTFASPYSLQKTQLTSFSKRLR